VHVLLVNLLSHFGFRLSYGDLLFCGLDTFHNEISNSRRNLVKLRLVLDVQPHLSLIVFLVNVPFLQVYSGEQILIVVKNNDLDGHELVSFRLFEDLEFLVGTVLYISNKRKEFAYFVMFR
jgi:hypothetical protein